ncbi:type II secretion system protein [Pseudothermotoga sp.]|nr:hypothetical protein [Pseudothermotoga sp.]MCX7813796.1 hypothetical protein [Pseudothermotoga sp.]MDW8140649.1 hypothetical protein [Pseudothermotoga sp.]
MKSGTILVEMLVCLVLVAIIVIFAFDAIINSLNISSRHELEMKTISLLNFVQSYLAEYRVGNEITSDIVQNLNTMFHGTNTNAFPRILEATKTDLSITDTNVTYRYRIVKVKVAKNPHIAEEFVLLFGY